MRCVSINNTNWCAAKSSMTRLSDHDALCDARRFKSGVCTCKANLQLTQPWRKAYADEPMESGTKSRSLIDRPLNNYELREMGIRQVSDKTLKNRARVQRHRAKKRMETQDGC